VTFEGKRVICVTILDGSPEQIVSAIESFPSYTLDHHPHEGVSSADELASLVVDSVRAWEFGLGCGRDVSRDHVAEVATPEIRSTLHPAADRRTLVTELTEALGATDCNFLDEPLIPEKSPAGAISVRESSMLGSIFSSIRHTGEHLGHLELTRDMLSD